MAETVEVDITFFYTLASDLAKTALIAESIEMLLLNQSRENCIESLARAGALAEKLVTLSKRCEIRNRRAKNAARQ